MLWSRFFSEILFDLFSATIAPTMHGEVPVRPLQTSTKKSAKTTRSTQKVMCANLKHHRGREVRNATLKENDEPPMRTPQIQETDTGIQKEKPQVRSLRETCVLGEQIVVILAPQSVEKIVDVVKITLKIPSAPHCGAECRRSCAEKS